MKKTLNSAGSHVLTEYERVNLGILSPRLQIDRKVFAKSLNEKMQVANAKIAHKRLKLNKDNFILSRNKIVRQMLDSAVPKYNIIVKLSKT